MVRPTLKKQIPNLQEAIKETARKQIAEFGAPSIFQKIKVEMSPPRAAGTFLLWEKGDILTLR
jgi:hypothetical protein